MTGHDPHAIDRRAARRAFSRASARYDQVAVLQSEVRQQMLERVALLKLQPDVILDLGSGTGAASRELSSRYPGARIVAMDSAIGMLQHGTQQQGWMRRLFKRDFQSVCADAFRLPLRDASVDLVFSNLMLQWCDPPDAVFVEIRRVLKPQGVMLFSSFGPDTLKELRAAWASVDGHTHVNRFVDMHDLGDAMMRAGLSEPVLDVDRFTLTYPDVMDLMRELKDIGAHNVTAGRRHGLTGRTALKQMTAAYEIYRREGVLPASYEVVCGQAWGNDRPLNLLDLGPRHEVSVPISRIGRRTRRYRVD